MDDYVEVRDEPRHRHRIENDHARIYDVLIPSGDTTLYHRHTEDTLYVAIALAQVEDQTWGETATTAGRVPPGFAMCRGHRNEPLTHRVTNVGETDMRMIGIEVKASPPVTQTEPLAADKHELLWTRERLRAYRIALEPGESLIDLRYNFSGATVFTQGCCLEVSEEDGHRRSLLISAGDVIWHDGPMTQSLRNIGPDACEAILAEWR